MSNKLPARLSDLTNHLTRAAQEASIGAGFDGVFMKFNKTGEWSFGAEDQEVDADSEWVINPEGFTYGYIAWGTQQMGTAGEKLGEVLVPVTQPLPPKDSLDEVKGEWTVQVSMQMMCVSGFDDGFKAVYNTNSGGGKKAFSSILTDIAKKINEGEGKVAPIVNLSCESYRHKTYGKTFNPVLDVIDWLSLEELQDLITEENHESDEQPSEEQEVEKVVEAAEEKEPEEKPVPQKETRSRRSRKAEVKEAPAEEKPARRRRRSR